MKRILIRTFNLEVLISALVAMSVLLIVFIASDVANYLSLVVSGKAKMSVVFQIIALNMPMAAIEYFPLGLLLGVILVLGRMAQDSEFVVWQASGIGFGQVYRYIMRIGAPIFVGLLAATLYLIPIIKSELSVLKSQIGSNALLENLSPGQFHELGGGNQVIYVKSIKDGQIEGVFLQISANDGQQHLLNSKKGKIELDDQGNKVLSLIDGTRMSYQKNSLDFTKIRFKRHAVLLPPSNKNIRIENEETMSSWALLGQLNNPKAQAELQFRCYIPIMALMMILTGVGLSHNKPRSGKFGKLIPGLILYFLYFNFIFVVYRKIESGEVSPYPGIWGIHVLYALICGFLMWQTVQPLKSSQTIWQKLASFNLFAFLFKSSK